MAGTKIGALKIRAKWAGLSVEEYNRRIAQGYRRCTICKKWKRLFDFCNDTSRPDGISRRCRACGYKRRTHRPGPSARRLKALIGLSWCNGCSDWLPSDQVKYGNCSPCKRRYERERYANDPIYQRERKNHRTKYQRGVEDVPIEGREILLESFGNKCAYCDNDAATWDHIKPVSKGGLTTPHNIVPACKHCNSSKRNRDVYDWMERMGIDPKPVLIDHLAMMEWWG